MSGKRRGRPGPPTPRRQGPAKGVSAAVNGRAEDVLLGDGAVAALRGALKRDGYVLVTHDRKSVQRRGRDLSVVFQVTLSRDGEERSATAVVHTTTGRIPAGATTVLVSGLRVHVWRYPSDPYLPGLHRATSRRKILELLEEFGAGQEEVDPEAVSLSRRVYRPTRRAVIQADLAHPSGASSTFYVKVLGDRDPQKLAVRTAELARLHRELAAHLPVPVLIGVREDQGIVAMENIPGQTLRLTILDGKPSPSPAEVADLALSLSRLQVESTASPIRYADPTRHAKVIGGILPDQATRILRLVAQCHVEGPLVTVHGDFHDGQVLVHEGRISGLIDVDGVGVGHLAHDAGRMIAYVESIGDIDRADPGRVAAWSQGLQDAFAEAVDRESLVRATAGAWIALATGPHRRQQADWETLTRTRIDHAERWLGKIGAV